MRTSILKTTKVLFPLYFLLSTFLVLLTFTFSLSTAFAQSPEKMSYQAVIRNSSNALVTNQAIGMRTSILQGSISGAAVYVEIYNPNPTTNANGLITIEIGTGIPSTGSFSTIDWSAGPYFIKTETDPTGGTNYTITGTNQLLSVPYALHAKTAETVETITETDPVFEASVASSITATDTTNWNNKLDSYTETDPIYSASEAANITTTDITNLSNLSGTNTGDQDLSGLATKTALSDSTAKVNTALATKVDKISGKGLSTVDYSKADSTKLAGISGTNTGDQDLSSLATKTALSDSVALLRSTHYIGELYGGGIIVFVWKESGVEHGLIAALTDQSTGLIWTTSAYQSTTVPGGALSPIDGLANSNAIVAQAGAGITYAAGLCRAYSATGDGGLNDWYLPASWELNQCYNAAFVVNKILGTTNGFQFANYWSSTETSLNYAWIQHFFNGNTNANYNKNVTCKVRAVRRF